MTIRGISQVQSAQAVFGLFDGATSALGLVISLAIASNVHTLTIAVVALSIAAGIGMAFGEWLSDSKSSISLAVIMGIATFVGTILPAIPFFVLGSTTLAFVLCGLTTLCIGSIIAELRPGDRKSSYLKTFSVLTIATGVSIAAALIV